MPLPTVELSTAGNYSTRSATILPTAAEAEHYF